MPEEEKKYDERTEAKESNRIWKEYVKGREEWQDTTGKSLVKFLGLKEIKHR